MIDELQNKTIQDKVEYVLQNHSVTRDDDKKLWLLYLILFHDLRHKLGEEACENFCDLYLSPKVPANETLRRIRQKFQEQGKYIGTKRAERLNAAKKVKTILKVI